MADIGYVSLLLAFATSLFSLVAFILGIRFGYDELRKSARNAIIASFALVSFAVIALMTALITHDFQINYVYSYTSTDMSPLYLISALWGGNAGSLLFWAWLLSVFGAILVLRNLKNQSDSSSYASVVLSATLILFLLLLIFVANPFEKSTLVPSEGRGLNPLLENFGMVIHPPALLMGYAALAVPFGLTVGALISGKKLGGYLAGQVRKWAIFAWLTLGVGNIIGMWWAYEELGWGGYWGWDPVENAGLMPWLAVTAYVHSLMMQNKRGVLKAWSPLMIIIAFNLAMFGTYLTRSDLLNSVHTFGDTGMEPYFLSFITISLLGSVGLLIYRLRDMVADHSYEFFSREGAFLLTNILLLLATGVIFVMTMTPWLSELVMDRKEWKSSQFDVIVGIIFLLIVLLMGICAVMGWRQAKVKNLGKKLLPSAIVAGLLCILLAIVGVHEWYALVFFPLLALVAMTILMEWGRGIRARCRTKGENPFEAFFGLIQANRSRYGGMIVHLGIVLLTMGIIGSSFYDIEEEAMLHINESMEVGDYTLVFEDFSSEDTPSRTIVTARVAVYRDTAQPRIAELTPEKYFHKSFSQPITEVAIRTTPAEDLYVILEGWDDSGADAFFRVKVNPMVMWMWIGGFVLLIGGVVSLWPNGRAKGDSGGIGI
ncbi:MAG: cytochrome c-type biogenesis CcmF C-terminal domain-containing protein [Chloroflexota bacterium]|nr:cytochrome c-type biogenesis CcmF C-terminal domain-containing protein [Chloroflexota bacterium]